MKSIDIIPVIHVQTLAQALFNVETILSCGLNKAMFISMDANRLLLTRTCGAARLHFPSLWIGANFLEENGKTKDLLYNKYPFINALWSDRTPRSKDLDASHRQYTFFGGLAFKYQPQPEDLKEACHDAMKCMDVITTSGPGTGKIPDEEKIKTIRSFIGDHHLAIASGVSSTNIPYFVGLVDHVLVASSITELHLGKEFIVPAKLKELCLAATFNSDQK